MTKCNIKDSLIFAFAQGFYERLRYGESAGRTHTQNHTWNECYDQGMNLADRLRGQP